MGATVLYTTVITIILSFLMAIWLYCSKCRDMFYDGVRHKAVSGGVDIRDYLEGIKYEVGVCSSCDFSNKVDTRLAVKQERGSWDARRFRSWLRDTKLRLDVQTGALIRGVPGGLIEKFVEDRTNAAAQAKYWREITDTSNLVQPTGSSDHNISNAFECNYFGEFRYRYMESIFSDCWRDIIRLNGVDMFEKHG
jgi:hypothetical protein